MYSKIILFQNLLYRYEVELELFEKRLEMYCQPCPQCQGRINRHLAQISEQLPKFERAKGRLIIFTYCCFERLFTSRSVNRAQSTIAYLQSITKRRGSIQSVKMTKLTISRLKLAVYASLIMTGIGNTLGLSVSGYFDIITLVTIFGVFAALYGTVPPFAVTIVTLITMKGKF